MKITHKQKAKIASHMKDGFMGKEWEARMLAIEARVKKHQKKSHENKNERTG